MGLGMASLYDFNAQTIDGDERPLRDYEGKVALVVTVASAVRPHAALRGARGALPQFQGSRAGRAWLSVQLASLLRRRQSPKRSSARSRESF